MSTMPIISVDGHVKAPRDTYRDYVEARYRSQFDEWATADHARAAATRAISRPPWATRPSGTLRGGWMQFARFLQREAQFSRLPSEYWETNCYCGISPFSPLQLPVEKLGSGYEAQPGEFVIRCERAMFGVDYPHFESIYPQTRREAALLANEPSVTEPDLRRILFQNAADVYGFDMQALQPVTDRAGLDLAAA